VTAFRITPGSQRVHDLRCDTAAYPISYVISADEARALLDSGEYQPCDACRPVLPHVPPQDGTIEAEHAAPDLPNLLATYRCDGGTVHGLVQHRPGRPVACSVSLAADAGTGRTVAFITQCECGCSIVVPPAPWLSLCPHLAVLVGANAYALGANLIGGATEAGS
jgi:hypothetical protein